MPKITKAHHTGFTVSSLARSLAFYRDLLGFEVAFQWNPTAPYVGELVATRTSTFIGDPEVAGDRRLLELLEYRNVEQVPVDMRNGNVGSGHIAFSVDDLDALYAELTAKGVTSVSPPVTPTVGPNRGGRAVYLIDPDGFRVELIESAQSFGSYRTDTDAGTAG